MLGTTIPTELIEIFFKHALNSSPTKLQLPFLVVGGTCVCSFLISMFRGNKRTFSERGARQDMPLREIARYRRHGRVGLNKTTGLSKFLLAVVRSILLHCKPRLDVVEQAVAVVRTEKGSANKTAACGYAPARRSGHGLLSLSCCKTKEIGWAGGGCYII